MTRRGTRRTIAVAALLAAFALVWAPTAIAAQGEPALRGKVVNGTTGEPAANLDVTLDVFGQQAAFPPQTATTDVKGRFAFAQLPDGATGYQVTATYSDVSFSSAAAAVPTGGPAEVTLKVYETTNDPTDVTQSWIIWVDAEGEGAAVQNDLRWTNEGDTAYAGNQQAPDGTPIVTQVPLAPGATNFQFLGTYLDSPGEVSGSTFIHPQPIVPGNQTATLRYSVPSLTELALPVTLPTDSIQLFVPAGVTVTADGLTASGQETDRGVTYQVFTASVLQTGQVIDVTLSGLGGGSGRSPLLFVLVATAVVAVIGALAIWQLGRVRARRPRGRSVRKGTGRRLQPEPRGRRAERNGRRGRVRARIASGPADGNGEQHAVGEGPEKDDVDLLIDEIAALDLAFERGLLERRSYETLRAAAKRRLLEARGASTAGRSER